MSRIVLYSREWSSSTGRYVRSLVNYLQKIDQTNEYFILLKPEDMDSWQPSNPRFHKVACPHKEFTFQEQIGLKKQIESLQPDLVHFTMVQQPVLYKGRSVTTMHDLITIRFKNPSKNAVVFNLKQQVYKWLNKKVAKKSDAIIVPTEFVKSDVITYTGADPDKITVTYESADQIKESPEPIANLQGVPFIMYIGRPTPHKNLPRLIESFRNLKITHPDLRLVLAGKKDSLYDAIEANAKAQGINGIVFTNKISEGTLRWLYENCRAYVFPSLSEGFGLPGLEAMIHHAPVVSSNASCLPEVYGDAAHYFDPLDVTNMTQKINDVLDDQELRQKLIKAGTSQVARYSWQRMAEQTLAIYTDVLKR